MTINKYQKYLGLPWKPDFNCWDFVRHIYREEFGLALPDWLGSIKTAQQAIADALKSGRWEAVTGKPQEGDFLILEAGEWERGHGHIGLMISETEFINSRFKTGVVIEKLAVWRRQNRVKGIYRLCER